ncbi:MAG: carbohydrate ABC transporter permease [Actinobacteria bacterium]|nr:carbohydrate ABC transporter permease [Actinomycetota bacterium]
MIRYSKKIKQSIIIIFIYLLGILYFFPILYTFLTSFKTEANVVPPSIFFIPTLESYSIVLKSKIWPYVENSVIVTTVTALLALVMGIPASYNLVFSKIKKSQNILFWFISTNLLPPVAIAIPLFLIFNYLNLLDSRVALIIVYTAISIPIVVWMTRSFLVEIPRDILEAASIDGCTKLRTFFYIILPLIKMGITSSALLVIIFTWNDFFFALNLTYVNAQTLPVYMATFMTKQGFFWAQLSAISTICMLPPLILGWISQKALVRGLTMGAVKG